MIILLSLKTSLRKNSRRDLNIINYGKKLSLVTIQVKAITKEDYLPQDHHILK